VFLYHHAFTGFIVSVPKWIAPVAQRGGSVKIVNELTMIDGASSNF